MVDVYLDIDHFRTVNHRLGFEGGDQALKLVAQVIRTCFPGDLVARFSDDHFVLVTRREGVEERLEELHERVSCAVPPTLGSSLAELLISRPPVMVPPEILILPKVRTVE
jgi:diguanylate cyclase (GGDEF)-like protein